MTWGKVTIRGGFLLLMAALFYFDTTGFACWLAPAAALHEAGHWLALRLFGARVEAWEFSLRGVEMRLPAWPALSYGRDFAATLAGPLFSLLGALLAARLAPGWGPGLYVLSGMSLAHGIYNLLPAGSLDGGRMLRLALCRFCSQDAADRALFFTTVGCAVLLAVARVYACLVSKQNFTLLLTAAYLALTMFPVELKRRQAA